jgi:hypothetical protein
MNDPAEDLLRISMSHGLPRCLHAVAELGIADALGESPRSAEELARDTATDAGALARTLRVLSAAGIFEPRDGAWGHTPASHLLRSDHPQSMRSFVRMIGLPVYWRGFEYFVDALRTGESVQERVVPGGFWRYLSEHPEAARLFDEAMMGKAAGQIAGVLGSYDFSAFGTIADIGGGRGHLLAAVLQAASRAQGVLFDQPHVTAAAQAAGMESERLRVHPGDFFMDALPSADCYLIMQVIHDWNDSESRSDSRRHSKGGGVGCQAPADRVHCSRGFEAKLDEDARSADADFAVGKRADRERVLGNASDRRLPSGSSD